MAAEVSSPITAAEARQTASDFARLIEENYLLPDIGRKYAEALKARAATGAYDGLGTRGALATALTRDAQAVHVDSHLRIRPQSIGAGPTIMSAPPPPAGPVEPAEIGPGQPIEEARWLAPGIAYIRFTIFPPSPAVSAAAAKFMADHADAKTIIFDVRTNRGGGMGQAVAVLPYLYDREVVFNAQDARASTPEGPPMPPWMRLASPAAAGMRTTEVVIAPHPTERRLHDANVIVLTSGFTVSAGEAFAFGLRMTGRATLIGEKTTGAGHFAPPGQRVNDKFTAFVPIGRAYDRATGMGWEGTGVIPDIEVPADRALVEALTRSGVPASEAEKLSAAVHPDDAMSRAKPNS